MRYDFQKQEKKKEMNGYVSNVLFDTQDIRTLVETIRQDDPTDAAAREILRIRMNRMLVGLKSLNETSHKLFQAASAYFLEFSGAKAEQILDHSYQIVQKVAGVAKLFEAYSFAYDNPFNRGFLEHVETLRLLCEEPIMTVLVQTEKTVN